MFFLFFLLLLLASTYLFFPSAGNSASQELPRTACSKFLQFLRLIITYIYVRKSGLWHSLKSISLLVIIHNIVNSPCESDTEQVCLQEWYRVTYYIYSPAEMSSVNSFAPHKKVPILLVFLLKVCTPSVSKKFDRRFSPAPRPMPCQKSETQLLKVILGRGCDPL